jgi:hypothetical protein
MKKENTSQNNTPFKVPKSYFDTFENSLFEKLSENTTLPKDEGFRIPKNYFENMDESLFQKLNTPKDVKIITLSRYKKLYYTIAAVAAAFLIFFSIKNTILSPGITINTVASADIERYINNGYLTLNSYDLAEIFAEDDFSDLTMATTKIEDDILIDYLSENVDHYTNLSFEN